jgi:hypothetical protein
VSESLNNHCPHADRNLLKPCVQAQVRCFGADASESRLHSTSVPLQHFVDMSQVQGTHNFPGLGKGTGHGTVIANQRRSCED